MRFLSRGATEIRLESPPDLGQSDGWNGPFETERVATTLMEQGVSLIQHV